MRDVCACVRVCTIFHRLYFDWLAEFREVCGGLGGGAGGWGRGAFPEVRSVTWWEFFLRPVIPSRPPSRTFVRLRFVMIFEIVCHCHSCGVCNLTFFLSPSPPKSGVSLVIDDSGGEFDRTARWDWMCELRRTRLMECLLVLFRTDCTRRYRISSRTCAPPTKSTV